MASQSKSSKAKAKSLPAAEVPEVVCEEKGELPTSLDLLSFMKSMNSNLSSEMKTIREELKCSISEHAEAISILKECQAKTEDDVMKLKIEANEKEQRTRNYSIRISNLPVPEDILYKPIQVIHFTYETVILPILQMAVDNKEIPSVPPALEIIEFGHVLRSRVTLPPIIIRFCSRAYRLLLFRYKSAVLPRLDICKNTRIYIAEDLTNLTYRRMKEIGSNKKVEKCFTIAGQIKYILASDKEKKIHTLKNPFINLDL